MNLFSKFDAKDVTVLCSCSRYVTLCRSYFCRYCYKMRCANCITHEIDCFYCPTCLENIPTGEANSCQDKCGNCFDCPSCGNMLSIRASVIQIQKTDSNMKVDYQKMYYMACNFCRWTTRDAGIADKTTASNAWFQPENPHATQISHLISQFNEYASKEKLEKEKSKYTSRKNYFFLMESGPNANRRRFSTQMRLNKRNSEVDKVLVKIVPQAALSEVNDIDESIFEKKLVLEEVTNIQQRLRDPERQPQNVKEFNPLNKQISVKRSMRCKECDHNLCKPEIATTSIRFKINLSSTLHVPELKIKPTMEKMEFNKTIKIILTLSNPAHRVTKVNLGPVTDFKDEISTAKLELPECELQIGPKNEMLALDDLDNSASEFPDDDSRIIADRKANKIEFYAQLTPMKSSGKVLSLIKLNFEFKEAPVHFTSNTGTPGQSTTPDTSYQTIIYKLDFGGLNAVSS